MFNIGQKRSHHAEQRQIRANAVHELNTFVVGEPAEFGRAAAFVLSPAASYLTGTMLPVDGGALRVI